MVGATIFFLAEYTIYSFTKMAVVLNEGSLASVIAYKFLWLMILTVAIGILAPVGVLIGSAVKKPHVGLIAWGVLVGAAMVGFTAISYLEVLSKIDQGDVPSPSAGMPKAASKLAELIQFVDAKATQVDPETIHVDIEFKNLSDYEFSGLDYTFIAVKDGAIFYRIRIRDTFYLPSKLNAKTSLTWKKSAIKDPKLYEIFQEALSKGELKMYAKPERVVRVDGKVIEGS